MKANKSDIGQFYNKPFPTRLRALLHEKGTSQAAFAEIIGISRQAANYYINGITLPDIERFEKIVDYFGVTADYLLGKSENRTLQNAAIGKELRLSDEAISFFKNSNVNASKMINNILVHPLFHSLCDFYTNIYELAIEYSKLHSLEYKKPLSQRDIDLLFRIENNIDNLHNRTGKRYYKIYSNSDEIRTSFYYAVDIFERILKDITNCSDEMLLNTLNMILDTEEYFRSMSPDELEEQFKKHLKDCTDYANIEGAGENG